MIVENKPPAQNPVFVAPCRGGRPPVPGPRARGVARIGMMVTVVNSGARAAGLGSPGGLTPDGPPDPRVAPEKAKGRRSHNRRGFVMSRPRPLDLT